MAIDISWLQEGLPLLSFALVLFLFYAILTKTKVLGGSKGINFIVSLIFALIFLTFTGVREYLINVTPWFTLLMFVLFILLLMIAFATKDWEKFTKPIAIVFIILLVLIAIVAMFKTFPLTQALLPEEIKEDSNYCSYSYDYDYYPYRNCYDKGDGWKCYDSRDRVDYYDNCYKSSGEYKCYDYNSKDYDSRYCETNKTAENIFERIHDWLYQNSVLNAIFLLIIAAIAAFIVTRV